MEESTLGTEDIRNRCAQLDESWGQLRSMSAQRYLIITTFQLVKKVHFENTFVIICNCRIENCTAMHELIDRK